MFVYLDESGDAGFRFTKGSSRFLIVTLLLVDDPIPIQAAVDDVRRALGFNPYDEFKFNHSDEAVRLRVLRELRRQRFSAQALVVDKTLILRSDLRRQDALYDELVRTILVYASDAILDATLVLDQSVKSRRRQDHLSTLLRQALNTDPQAPRVAHVVYHESHRDNLNRPPTWYRGQFMRDFTVERIATFALFDRSLGNQKKDCRCGRRENNEASRYPGACPGTPPSG
jgi:Protein of unknown function (DUF3800)